MILVWRTLKVEAWMLNLDVACMESSSDHPLVSIPLLYQAVRLGKFDEDLVAERGIRI